MSNKNLLSESQVRKFMKLARLEPLTPGFVEGLTEATTTDEDLEEGRQTRPPGGNASHGRSSEPLPGEKNLMREEDDELEAELHATEDELGAEDRVADEEGDELDDLEADEGGRTVSVDDFLAALESALEDVMGDEVEVTEEPPVDDVEDEFAPEGEEVVADEEVEMELQEGTDEGTDDELEEGTKKGDIKKPDLKKKGHHGRGPKRRETAEEEDELAYEQNESTEATDELVEQITKRVAARILKSALSKKK